MSDTCQALLDAIFSSSSSSAAFWKYQQHFVYSGKFINDLGLVDGCESLNETKFVLTRINPFHTRPYFYYGFCGPSVCRPEDYAASQSYLGHLKNVSYSAFNLTNNPNEFSIRTTDPSVFIAKTDLGFYVTLFVWIVLLALVIAGTVLEYRVKKGVNQAKGENTRALLTDEDRSEITGWRKFVLCFSFWRNFWNLIKSKPDRIQELNILNGLKLLSVMYIAYGFTYVKHYEAVFNRDEVPSMSRKLWSQVLYSVLFASDIFLYVSGFFFAFNCLKAIQREEGSLKPMLYLRLVLQRIYKLWPMYVLVLLFYWRISIYMQRGPLWNEYVEQVTSTCDANIWQNLILLDNWLVPLKDNSEASSYCFNWGWYVAVEIQLVLFTPLIIYLAHKGKDIGVFLLFLICFGPVVAGIKQYSSMGTNLRDDTIDTGLARESNKFFMQYYINPLYRAGSYYFGISLGFFYWCQKNQISGFFKALGDAYMNYRSLRVFSIFFGFAFTLCMMLGPHQVFVDAKSWSQQHQAIYAGASRQGFLFGLSLMVIPSMLVPNFLSRLIGYRHFMPFAKLSYLLYLFTPIVLGMAVYSAKQTAYFAHGTMWQDFVYNFLSVFLTTLETHFLVEGSIKVLGETYFFKPNPLDEGGLKESIQADEDAER